MSTATMRVLEVDELKILADGGYSNAQAVAQCERDNVEVAAPIKRGAMSTDFFRPTQFTYDASSHTIRCPAGDTRDRFSRSFVMSPCTMARDKKSIHAETLQATAHLLQAANASAKARPPGSPFSKLITARVPFA
jgi:hypothetical protein